MGRDIGIGIESFIGGIDWPAKAGVEPEALQEGAEPDDGSWKDMEDAFDGALAIIRVVRRDEGDASLKRLPMAASKLLSSSGSVSGIGWLRLLVVPAPGALEKKSSMTALVH